MNAKKITLSSFQVDFSRLTELEQMQSEKAAKLEKRISTLRAKHEEETAAVNSEIIVLRERIARYAEMHKGELLDGKKKSVTVGQGCLKWRKSPASVQITGSLEDVLATLKKRRLTRFIRTKEELNKTLLLAEAELLQKKPITGLAIIEGGEVLTINTKGAL